VSFHDDATAARAYDDGRRDGWRDGHNEGSRQEARVSAELRAELAAERAHADRLAEALRWSGTPMETKGERRDALAAHDARRAEQ
jgi:hypothetical protein